MIKLIFCDDHQVVIEGLNMIFDREQDIHVLGSFKEKAELFSYLTDTDTVKPDVVLVDFHQGNIEQGFELMKNIPKWEQFRWVLFSSFVDDFMVFKAKRMGFQACYSKDVPITLLIHTILNPSNDFLSYPIAEYNGKQKMEDLFNAFYSLTKREKDILRILTLGKPSKETALQLHISRYTLETHKKNIFRKLDINSLPELIRMVEDFKLFLS